MSTRLSDDQAIERTRWLFENGTVRQTDHFRRELRAAGADMIDVQNAIADPDFHIEKAEYDRKRRVWRYTLEGCDEKGELLDIVVALDLKNSKLVLITAF